MSRSQQNFRTTDDEVEQPKPGWDIGRLTLIVLGIVAVAIILWCALFKEKPKSVDVAKTLSPSYSTQWGDFNGYSPGCGCSG